MSTRTRQSALDRVVGLQRLATLGGMALVAVVVAVATLNSLHLSLPGFESANPAPQVVPALREWRGTSGAFTLAASGHVDMDPTSAQRLSATAKVFASDLAAVTGHTLAVLTTDSPGSGDFYLTLRTADAGIGSEGYLLNVADFVTISGNSSAGVLYGTRTVLQIFAQDPAHARLPRGFARDYPQYHERGLMLDVGRKFIPLPELEDYVRLMAWYKLNDLHLHLNDNVFGVGLSPGWQQDYAAFRLNSPRFPGLAAKDGSYTRADMRALQDLAAAYGVTITPEIDAPAHALAFTQYRPDLASPRYSKDFLDLDNPATYAFLNSIWDEFLPWFDTAQVHIGADEYAPQDADNYRRFINTYDAYLKGKGKSVRVWGSLSIIRSGVKVNTDVVVDLWNNEWANPVDTVRQGYDVINCNDNLLYIVPKAGSYHDYLDTRQLYVQWAPNIFSLSDSSLNLAPDDPHLLGAMFADWNDRLGSVIGDADVAARVQAAMPTLGQKMWTRAAPSLTFDQFQRLAQQIGGAPGTHLPQLAAPAALAAPLSRLAAA